MSRANAILRFSVIVSLLVAPACSKGGMPGNSVQEITGSRSERVAGVSALISKHRAPPTPILDAHFVEEQTGDGMLGPSDFRSFYLMEVAPETISAWTQILEPLEELVDFEAPAQPRDWWIARDAFASLQFYEPDILTGKVHGWIGVSQPTGRIYIFTFTM